MYNKIIESTKYIRSKVNRMPKIAIILVSGLVIYADGYQKL
ncbi:MULTISPECIES: hypothetical protein [unclassified Clostridium]|nr:MULTISPECIES: hypothetical protein [unclassified Clostridium]